MTSILRTRRTGMAESGPDPQARGTGRPRVFRRRVVLRAVVVVAVLALLVHVLLLRLGTVEGSLRVVRTMRPGLIALALSAQACSYLGSGYLLRSAVTLARARTSLARAVGITMAGSSLGLVAGGAVMHGPASYRWIRASPASPQAAVLGSIATALFNDALLVGLSLSGLVYLLAEHDLTRRTAVAFAVLAALLVAASAVALWSARHPARVTELLVDAGRRLARLRHRPYNPDAARGGIAGFRLALLRLRQGGWHGPALGSAANLGFDMLTLWLLFAAAGHAISPGMLATGYALPLLLGKAAFVIPGGIGVVEGSMATMYQALGVPGAETAVVVLAYGLLSFWLPNVAGLALVPYFQRGVRRRRAVGG
jgi:glycosyltransferase 2 family protein